MSRFWGGFKRALAWWLAGSLVACGGGGGGGSDASSGSSGVGAPASILATTLVETVSKSGYVPGSPGSVINISQPGDKIQYSFIDASTILGAGLITVPTLSWSYTASGNVARVKLHMRDGDTTDVLTFTSPTGGTFRSDGVLSSGTTFWFEGTFTISPYTGGSGGSGGGSSGGSGGGSSGGSTTTGQVSFWTNRSTGQISVSVDGSSIGTLTSYFNSRPSCGASGTLTKTLSAGSHSMSAKSTTGATWGPASFTVTAGNCLIYQLQ